MELGLYTFADLGPEIDPAQRLRNPTVGRPRRSALPAPGFACCRVVAISSQDHGKG